MPPLVPAAPTQKPGATDAPETPPASNPLASNPLAAGDPASQPIATDSPPATTPDAPGTATPPGPTAVDSPAAANPPAADPATASPTSVDPEEARWGRPEFWGAVTRGWKPYRHPNGFRLKLPSDWKIRDAGRSLTLRPRDPSLKGLGFGVGHVSLPDVKDVGNVEQFRAVQSTFVSGLAQYRFKATGEQLQRLDIADQSISGASLRGVNPRTGEDVLCMLYLTQVGANQKGHFMFVLSSDTALLKSRGRFLARALISTFANSTSVGEAGQAAGAPQATGTSDATAVGSWVPARAYRSAGLSVTIESTLHLREGGVCVLMGPSDEGSTIVNEGRWSATAGTLSFAWKTASMSVHDYEILSVYAENDNMLWTTPRRLRWRRAK